MFTNKSIIVDIYLRVSHDLGPQSFEVRFCQTLRQHVCDHFVCGHVRQTNGTFFVVVANHVVPQFNVLAARRCHFILSEFDCRLVVLHELDWCLDLYSDFTQDHYDPDDFVQCV